MDQQGPQQKVTGSVSWNNPKADAANEPVATGPLTGQAVKPAGRSSGRSKKSASAFRTISEVAEILDVQQHVLRFWETKFSQVRPLKRGGGRRYYRPEDLALLQKIHHLLYTEGYTIKGVQKLLKEQGKKAVLEGGVSKPSVAPAANVDDVQSSAVVGEALSHSQRAKIEGVLNELKDIRKIVVPE